MNNTTLNPQIENEYRALLVEKEAFEDSDEMMGYAFGIDKDGRTMGLDGRMTFEEVKRAAEIMEKLNRFHKTHQI